MKTTAEKIAVMQAFVDGKPIEYVLLGCSEWFIIEDPCFDWKRYDYRIAVTKPSINPDHVAYNFKWMFTLKNGSTFLSDKEPILKEYSWNPEGSVICAEHFKSFIPGTCDWKDSLVRIR